MRALITGIAGFAGNYLAELLLGKGYEVFGASLENEFKPFLPIDRGAICYTPINIQDQAGLEHYLSDTRPDLVFHLAAKSSPSQSTKYPQETFAVNLGGTLALLEAIRLRQIGCRLLLVSSSHVYGSRATGDPDQPVAEDAPLKPESPYAASKAAAEMAAYQYWKSYDIHTVTVRAFNHTGAGQGPGFVCPDLARKVVEIERGLRPPKLEVASLDRQIDISNVRDVVLGYYSALVTSGPAAVYNLCSGRPLTLRTIAENLINGSERAISVLPLASESPGRGGRGIIGNGARALRDLGWHPAIPVEDTLREVIEYWRQVGPASPEPARMVGGE